MRVYYSSGNFEIYCGDCRDILGNFPDSVRILTDPPYGINYKSGQKHLKSQSFGDVCGDSKPFDPTALFRFTDIICWGANNYSRSIPEEGQWYCWDKVCQNGINTRNSECEFAWHKKGTKPRVFRHLYSGAYRHSESGQRSMHPTQKPVALMKWCLSLMKLSKGAIVCDPYMGVGTTLVAARHLNIKVIGIEISEEYCKIAISRLGGPIVAKSGIGFL